MHYSRTIARALLKIHAVEFCAGNPVVFTSGLEAPVYVDNRKLPFWPNEWHAVIDAFRQKITEEAIEFDVIAGIETAGIPHSSAFAYVLQKPSVFVRKKAKEHGTKKKVEGGNVSGKKVVLVEDLVTTGASSLSGVQALRDEGARISECLIIVTYGFPESKKAFQEAKVNLHALTSFPIILQEAQQLGKISSTEKQAVEQWLQNPYDWAPYEMK